MKRFRFHALRAAALMLALATSTGAVHAAKVPRPTSTDARVKQVRYDPNQVYEIVGVYGYTVGIQFAESERILNYAFGDSIAWQPNKFRNKLFLKPVEPNARTNLTVTTNRRTYFFHLTSTTNPDKATYVVQFRYPEDDDQTDPGDTGGRSPGGAGVGTPRAVNKTYAASGDEKAFGLLQVFDDGQFTYFQVNPAKPKPAIYVVDADGTELLANIRREGPYLVVEQLATKFTLRDGERVLCVARSSWSRAGAESPALRGNGS